MMISLIKETSGKPIAQLSLKEVFQPHLSSCPAT